MASTHPLFYNAEEIMKICNCGRSKAYNMIKSLGDSIEKQGYLRPPNGKIQKKLFCDKTLLSIDDCENLL